MTIKRSKYTRDLISGTQNERRVLNRVNEHASTSKDVFEWGSSATKKLAAGFHPDYALNLNEAYYTEPSINDQYHKPTPTLNDQYKLERQSLHEQLQSKLPRQFSRYEFKAEMRDFKKHIFSYENYPMLRSFGFTKEHLQHALVIKKPLIMAESDGAEYINMGAEGVKRHYNPAPPGLHVPYGKTFDQSFVSRMNDAMEENGLSNWSHRFYDEVNTYFQDTGMTLSSVEDINAAIEKLSSEQQKRLEEDTGIRLIEYAFLPKEMLHLTCMDFDSLHVHNATRPSLKTLVDNAQDQKTNRFRFANDMLQNMAKPYAQILLERLKFMDNMLKVYSLPASEQPINRLPGELISVEYMLTQVVEYISQLHDLNELEEHREIVSTYVDRLQQYISNKKAERSERVLQ